MILFYRLIVHDMALLFMYKTDEHISTTVSTTFINYDYRLKYCMPHYLFIALNISQGYFSFLLCYFILMKVKDCRKPCKQSKALSFAMKWLEVYHSGLSSISILSWHSEISVSHYFAHCLGFKSSKHLNTYLTLVPD